MSKLSVPVAVAAKVYGKDAAWVRAGIIEGWLPIGTASRKGKAVTSVKEISSKLGRINYYISPKLLYEQTGYIYGKEKTNEHHHTSGTVERQQVLYF